MPIVDGLTSTQMIRAFEKTPEHTGYSKLAAIHGRIPIFAVSASLVETDKQIYINAGFDGWILKPIDFKRLNTLLNGIHEDEIRRSCLYVAGEWEHGGWFQDRRAGDGDSSDDKTPTVEEEKKEMPGAVAGEPPADDATPQPTVEQTEPGV